MYNDAHCSPDTCGELSVLLLLPQHLLARTLLVYAQMILHVYIYSVYITLYRHYLLQTVLHLHAPKNALYIIYTRTRRIM